jgi:hypothetical protein
MFNNEYPNKYQSAFRVDYWILSIQYWIFLLKLENVQYPMFNNEYSNNNQSAFRVDYWILSIQYWIFFKIGECPISNVQ